MDLKFINDIAMSQAVWAVCCILLVGFILKKVYEKNDKQEVSLKELHTEYRTESREREQKLMEHLEKSNESQARTAASLERVEENLSSLKDSFTSLDNRVVQLEQKRN